MGIFPDSSSVNSQRNTILSFLLKPNTLIMTASSSMKIAGLVLLGLLPHLAAAVDGTRLKQGDFVTYRGDDNAFGEVDTQWEVSKVRNGEGQFSHMKWVDFQQEGSDINRP